MRLRDVLSWISDHKTSTAGLVLVVAGALSLVSLSRRVHHLQLRPAAASRPSPRAPAATSEATASSGASTEQDTRTARMRGEFENAPDYLAFIQQAMSRPQDGGKFYALLAWRRCDELGRHKEVADTPTGDDAIHVRALALVQELRKRCTGVLETYADVQALYTVVTQQRGGTDALLPASGRGIGVPSGRDTANADIDAAIRSGDRWAQARALRDNADFLDVGNRTGDDGVDRQLHEWGAEIVACELVGDCRGGIEVSLHCVASGDCAHDDYRDVVRDKVPDAQRPMFETVLEGLRLRMGLTQARSDQY